VLGVAHRGHTSIGLTFSAKSSVPPSPSLPNARVSETRSSVDLATLHFERGVPASEAARALGGVERSKHEAAQVVQRLRTESRGACLQKRLDACR